MDLFLLHLDGYRWYKEGSTSRNIVCVTVSHSATTLFGVRPQLLHKLASAKLLVGNIWNRMIFAAILAALLLNSARGDQPPGTF
jgi:hypothetical protein